MNSPSDDIDHVFKIVLIGDTGVGKSQILFRFTKDQFDADSTATVGVEFTSKKIIVNDISVKIQLWDTAGQEKFRAISKVYYRGAVGAVLVYDITNEKSFTNIERWLTEIREWADQPNIIVMMVGNKKLDCKDDRKVSKETALQFAENNKMGFVETSAKTGINIEFAFKKIVEEILRQVDSVKRSEHQNYDSELQQQSVLSQQQSKNIELNTRDSQKVNKKNSGCC